MLYTIRPKPSFPENLMTFFAQAQQSTPQDAKLRPELGELIKTMAGSCADPVFVEAKSFA